MFHRTSIVLALCACCATARADTLVLANGDTLHGEIVEWDMDSVVLEHPQLGRVRLALDELAVDTGKPPSRGLFDTAFLRGWKRSIDLGLNGKQGSDETTNLTSALHFNYADDFKRWDLRGRYFFSRDEDGTSDNYARVDLRRDWLIPGSRRFTRASVRYQFDNSESWKHRIVAVAAPGYRLVDTRAYSLDATLGGAFTREFGERNENKGDGVWGLDNEWKISGNLSLKLSNQVFFELTPTAGEIRNVTIGEWKFLLTEAPDLSLKLGAENEYETDIEPGDKHNNLRYYMSLGLDF